MDDYFTDDLLKGWLAIMLRDPLTWRWLAWTMSFPHKASVV